MRKPYSAPTLTRLEPEGGRVCDLPAGTPCGDADCERIRKVNACLALNARDVPTRDVER